MTMHRVEEGQRLSEIAAKYGITTDEIVRANPTKEAVTLPSGAQVFASLAAGDDIALPGVLGAAESDYPRKFYQQAYDALRVTLSMDLKSAGTLDQVAQAAASMKSAVTYLQTHTLTSSKYRDQLDAVVYAKGILNSIDTLDAILRGQSVVIGSNYYVLLGSTLQQLENELDKWPKPAAASGTMDFVFHGNLLNQKPKTGAFPTGAFPTGSGPKYGPSAGSGSVPTTDAAETACAAKGARLNRQTGMCDASDGTSSKPFPDVTWGGPANVKLPSDTEAGAPAVTAAECSAKGMVFDVKTKACVPEFMCADGTVMYKGQCLQPGVVELYLRQDENAKQEAEKRAAVEKARAEAEKAAAASASSTTKKVLIVAGSVVALGLAGWGAWHVLAKDKAPEKPGDKKAP